MERITPPIRPQDHSPAVANFQHAMLFIVEKRQFSPQSIPLAQWQQELSTEMAAQSFGERTTRLFAGLLTDLRLPVADFVNESTAAALNGVLDNLGAFSPVRSPQFSAELSLSLGVRGPGAAELHASLDKLGYEIPRLELDDQVFGAGTQSAVRQLQSKYGLPLTGILNRATKSALARAIAAADTDRPQVAGRILFDHGLPAGGVTLRLYNRGFGGTETRLGEIKTDAQGFYALSYDAGGKMANLEVRAVDDHDGETPLSETKFNADRRAVLNLVVPSRIVPLAAEYPRLAADLTKHVGELGNLKDARENDERNDLRLLHEATGWDARLIALAASAHKLAGETGLSPDVVYGLARAGLPTDKQSLARVPTATVEKALGKAREAGIVALSDEQLVSNKVSFEKFARETRRADKAHGALSTLGELLKSSGLSEAEQTIFEDVHFAHGDGGTELWQKAREAGIPEAKISGLRLQGKLAYLTHNNAALTDSLLQEVGSLEKLSRLVTKDLYQSKAWVARLKAMGNNSDEALQKQIPPAYEGKTVADRLDAYAADLARKVRASFPTRIVSRMIEKDELRLGANHAALKVPVQTFLEKAGRLGFELGRVGADAFIRANKDALFTNKTPAEVESTSQSIKKLQRLYQITPNDAALKVLLDEGFTSAYDVVAFRPDVFLESFGDKFGSPAIAQLVYRKAQQVSAVSYSFFTTAKQLDSAPPVYAISGPADAVQSAKNELIKHYPTMESLFGSLDFCECEHCRSVLSPAAYLVDLLKFLDPDDVVWTNFLTIWKNKHSGKAYDGPEFNYKRPYDALIERRPDLPHLPLTCENTNTVLPYIDVVNEILEYYVANNKLDPEAVHDTGESTTAELLAEPQNIIPAAYDALNQARYPLTLPFDLWLETVRQFFEYFETPLWCVLEIFRRSDELVPPDPPAKLKAYYRADIFSESLGVSPAEYGIFTDPKSLGKWHELYGYKTAAEALTAKQDSNGQHIDLNSAKALSRRLGVSYKQLVDLMRTWFVNPRLDALIILRKLSVEIEDVFRFKGHPKYPPFTVDEQADFKKRLLGLKAEFAFDAEAWLDTAWQNGDFNAILVLADPDTGCNFDLTTLQYADGNPADALVFLRVNLFVRLWKKLGWAIEETDRALRAFLPAKLLPLTQENPKAASNLGSAFKTALLYFAHLKTLDERVNVGKNSRQKLLTLWSNLPTTGKNPLYAQLFLTRSMLKSDPVFDDPLGNYLSKAGIAKLAETVKYEANQENVQPADKLDPIALAQEPAIQVSYDEFRQVQRLTFQGVLSEAKKTQLKAAFPSSVLAALLDDVKAQAKDYLLVKGHLLSLQSALNLTADEVERILGDAGKDVDTAELSLDNVSLLYRHGLLAKALKLSVDDLIILKRLSGIDLFRPLKVDALTKLDDDHPFSQTLRFVEIAEEVKESGFRVEDLAYLLRHRFDAVGKYRPDTDVLVALVKSLATGIRSIRAENAVQAASLTDDGLRQKFGFVLQPDMVEEFLGLLTGSAVWVAVQENVSSANKLDPKPFAGESAISVSYDEVHKTQRLTYRGLLLDAKKAQLNAAIPSSALLEALLDAVQTQAFVSLARRVETVLGLLTATVDYEAIQENVQPSEKLDPAAFAGEPAIRISYDEASKTQRLAFRGILLDAKKGQLKTANLSPILASLLDAVQSQAGTLAEKLIRSSIAILIGAVEFEATEENVEPIAQVDPKAFDREPVIQVSYDEASKTQYLTCQGLLAETKKAKLKIAIPSQVVANLLDAVQNQAKAFIEKFHVGFLAASDFDSLFNDLGSLTDSIEDSRVNLAKAIVPFVEKKLTRQLVVQTLATSLNADPALIEALLTDARLLSDPSKRGEPLLEAFSGAGESGMSVLFFSSIDGTGAPLEKSEGANSALFDGYLEVPTEGGYRFFVALGKKDAEADLRFAHLPDPFLRAQAATDEAEVSQFTEFKPGVPYQFTLGARRLGGGSVALTVLGENLPKGSLDRLVLYPRAVVDRVTRARMLLAKTLQLIQGLQLSERELRHVLTHAADFDNLNLSRLPTEETDDSNAAAEAEADELATELFGQFLRLAVYARLKRDIAPDTDDLVGILENAQRTRLASADADAEKIALFDDLCQRVADLTRRDLSTVQETAGNLGFFDSLRAVLSAGGELEVEAPDFAQEKGLSRLWKALQAVETLGVTVEAIVRWTQIVNGRATSEAKFSLARDLKDTVKARYEPENWQRIAQPIFDKLRQRQRDALVALILHRHGFERVEELFEYFLIDPGMEPVVQTSRLRLAISSVQTFIQRCLLNIEPKVHPSAINSQHWQWMKRYRVWEANRKIFLWPENWLEPEFRDDKTHLFQELESALLQGDVSSDLVEDVFFNYLQKLEELALLEIVTICCEEKPDPTSNVLHVIGRTQSSHKYFYRRYSRQMWTPWEPVSAEIESDHVVAVIWHQRLHLFWATFMEKPKPDPTAKQIDVNINLDANNVTIPTAVPKQVEVQLNWSEYFQGQWTNRESGGFGDPIRTDVGPNFNSREVFIFVIKEYDDQGEESAVRIQFSGELNAGPYQEGQFIGSEKWTTAFRVVSKHSAPEVVFRDPSQPSNPAYSHSGARATRYTGSNALEVSFKEQIEEKSGAPRPVETFAKEPILHKGGNYSLVFSSNPLQSAPPEFAALISPFFYQDNQYAFLVEPTLTETTIEKWQDWVITNSLPVQTTDDDWSDVLIAAAVPFMKQSVPDSIDPIDGSARFRVQHPSDWITSPTEALQFDEHFVGKTGRLDLKE